MHDIAMLRKIYSQALASASVLRNYRRAALVDVYHYTCDKHKIPSV